MRRLFLEVCRKLADSVVKSHHPSVQLVARLSEAPPSPTQDAQAPRTPPRCRGRTWERHGTTKPLSRVLLHLHVGTAYVWQVARLPRQPKYGKLGSSQPGYIQPVRSVLAPSWCKAHAKQRVPVPASGLSPVLARGTPPLNASSPVPAPTAAQGGNGTLLSQRYCTSPPGCVRCAQCHSHGFTKNEAVLTCHEHRNGGDLAT